MGRVESGTAAVSARGGKGAGGRKGGSPCVSDVCPYPRPPARQGVSATPSLDVSGAYRSGSDRRLRRRPIGGDGCGRQRGAAQAAAPDCRWRLWPTAATGCSRQTAAARAEQRRQSPAASSGCSRRRPLQRLSYHEFYLSSNFSLFSHN